MKIELTEEEAVNLYAITYQAYQLNQRSDNDPISDSIKQIADKTRAQLDAIDPQRAQEVENEINKTIEANTTYEDIDPAKDIDLTS
jgi:hypothetical protein